MVNLSLYDFSKEAGPFKKKLLIKCRERLAKGLDHSRRVSDDDLELVAAAGAFREEKECPTPLLPCENCPKYSSEPGSANPCTDGCKK